MTLTTAQLGRACGVLLGTAAGDALGAAYEFGQPRGPELEVAMVGGGAFGWEPGEWTDDTSMAIAIAGVAATGADLRDEKALDGLARRWHEWMHEAKDVGIQTGNVLRAAARQGISAKTAGAASAALHARTGRTAGNGSLMRTAPLALSHLQDEAALVEAARAVSELTHYDPEAGDACVLWCLAIRHAILTGLLDARIGLQHIAIERRDLWVSRLNVAEASQPSGFTNNGWVVEALQAGRVCSRMEVLTTPGQMTLTPMWRAVGPQAPRQHDNCRLRRAVGAAGETHRCAGGYVPGVVVHRLPSVRRRAGLKLFVVAQRHSVHLKGTPRGEAAGRDRMVTGLDGKVRPSRRVDTGDRDGQIHALRAAGKSLRAIAAEVKCSVGTVARVLKS